MASSSTVADSFAGVSYVPAFIAALVRRTRPQRIISSSLRSTSRSIASLLLAGAFGLLKLWLNLSAHAERFRKLFVLGMDESPGLIITIVDLPLVAVGNECYKLGSFAGGSRVLRDSGSDALSSCGPKLFSVVRYNRHCGACTVASLLNRYRLGREFLLVDSEYC